MHRGSLITSTVRSALKPASCGAGHAPEASTSAPSTKAARQPRFGMQANSSSPPSRAAGLSVKRKTQAREQRVGAASDPHSGFVSETPPSSRHRSDSSSPRAQGPQVLYPKKLEMDLSSLPRLAPGQPKILFKGIDFESAIPAFHRPSSPSAPLCVYRDPLINMRAMPSSALPSRPTSPFPRSLIESASLHARRPEARIVQFGVVASKSNVSNLAVERARVRKRFKAAIGAVLQRSVGLPVGHRGIDYLKPDWSYVAMLSTGVYGASMNELCESVTKAFRWIRKLQDKAIGTERQRAGSVPQPTAVTSTSAGLGKRKVQQT